MPERKYILQKTPLSLQKDPKSYLQTRISWRLEGGPPSNHPEHHGDMLKTTNNLATTKQHTGNHSQHSKNMVGFTFDIIFRFFVLLFT